MAVGPGSGVALAAAGWDLRSRRATNVDSSGVMGLAVGGRENRWGIAGMMRFGGRRGCFWAAAAVSAWDGAMVVL